MYSLYNKDFHGVYADQCHYNNKLKTYCLDQISQTVKDKIVIDLGAGNGIFSFASAFAGAKKVYAVENNQFICTLLKKTINQEGWNDIISVQNKDFIEHDLSELYEQADIVVADIINSSLYNNIFPVLFLNLKSKYPHIRFIPDNFSYTGKIVQDKILDDQINWGFKNQQLNSALDKIALSVMPLVPMKLKLKPDLSLNTSSSQILINYNFDNLDTYRDHLDLPVDKDSKWLEIAAKVDKFEFYYEYVPLHIDFFNSSKKVSIKPTNFYHKLKILK